MALALRAVYPAGTSYSNAVASVSVVANDLIIVAYSYNTTLQSITVTDTASGGTNTYNQAGSGVQAVSGSNAAGHIFYAIAKATETVTITCTAESDGGAIVHVVSGANSTLGSVLDVVNTKADSSSTNAPTSASITTTNANDYLIVHWFQEQSSATLTENGTGFTKQKEFGGHYNSTFDQIVSSTNSYSDTVSASVSTFWNSLIASFKAAAGGDTFLGQVLT